ncbi:MAG TPA: cytochrome c3 family protein [Candidatus Baltobacteraceae bacterium]|nr:cytochrome c3 family protein [Candidatus Baltobacteraceae bacterium]
MSLLRLGVLVGLVFSVLGAVPMPQAGAADETPCIGCHKPTDTTIDPARYAQSVHGQLDCAMCHTEGFSAFPHSGTRTGAPDCTACHEGASPYDFDGIAKAVKESVHAKAVDPAFRCANCHSPHYFVPGTRLKDASEAIRTANQICLGCHAKGDTARQRQVALDRLATRHRWVPHWELHLRSAPCVACHTPSGQRTVHLVLPASAALRDCTTCHARNSMLVTKLYTHLAAKERAEQGWLNSILFNTAYVSGATRNRWLDWGTLGLTAVTILGVGAHAAGRWLGDRMRKRS